MEKKDQNKQNMITLNMGLQKWGEWKVDIILIVIGAMTTVTNRFEKWTEKTEFNLAVEMMQKLRFRTARILQKVLDMKWERRAYSRLSLGVEKNMFIRNG